MFRAKSKISWTQVETGSAITWKYPSCILKGDNSIGEFYSVAVTNNYQQADKEYKNDTPRKNTKSKIISKGISAGHSQNSYRGQVKVIKRALIHEIFLKRFITSRNKCGAHTFPILILKISHHVEHEATTSKIGEIKFFIAYKED